MYKQRGFYIIMLVFIISLIIAEWSNSRANSDLVGSIQTENVGPDFKVSYSFENISDKTVTVIGGAKYKLQKNNVIVEEGWVPVKDYIDLAPGEVYADKKIFQNLQPGTYTVHVEWHNTKVSDKFTR